MVKNKLLYLSVFLTAGVVLVLFSSKAYGFNSQPKIIDKLFLAGNNPKVIDKSITGKPAVKSKIAIGSVITAKDTYNLGEKVTISISTLDSDGNMVCKSPLLVEIVDKNNRVYKFSTTSGSILVTSNCYRHEFVYGPDISLDFQPLHSGEHAVHLYNSDSADFRYLLDSTTFIVNSTPNLEINRDTPHRVYPQVEQPMIINIKSDKYYRGQIVEQLPVEVVNIISNSKLTSLNTLQLLPANTREDFLNPNFLPVKIDLEKRQIVWDVVILPGKNYKISYGYEVAGQSPVKLNFKNLRLGNMSERRPWEIAVDGLVISTIDSTVSVENERYETGGNRNLVSRDEGTIYAFYVSGNSNGTASQRTAYKKSSNAGNTWGTEAFMSSATGGIELVSLWYDQWTPGDTTGSLIHAVYLNSTTDEVIYRSLDVSNDTLGDEVVVYSDDSTTRSAINDSLSITKATNGRLYIASSSSSSSSTTAVFVSDDNGSSWSEVSDEGIDDSSGDWVLLMPLLYEDILLIRWDLSTNTIESREYQAQGDTWDVSWASVATGADDSAAITETFSATLNPGNGTIYLAYLDNPGANPATIETRVYDGSSWSSTAQVRSNNTLQGVSMGYDSGSERVVIAYTLGTGETTLTLRYKESYDDMSSFGSERMIYNVNDDAKGVSMTMLSDKLLGAYAYDDDDRDLFYSSFIHSGGDVKGILLSNLTGFESSDAFDANSSTGTVSYSSSVFRSGEYSLRSNPSSATGYVTHPVQYAATGVANTADIDNVSVVFALRIAQTPSASTDIFNFMDGTINEMRVQLDTDRNINIIDASTTSGSYQLELDTWYVIAAYASDDYDAGELIIFSSDMQSLYERLTLSSTMNDIDSLRIGSQTASITTDLYIDDVVVYADDNTSSFPLFRANYQIHRMDLDSSGTDTAWTGDYSALDEIPTSSSDYVEVTNTIADETSNLESASSAGIDSDNIVGVMVKNTVWETTDVTSSVRTVRLRITGAIETTAVNVSTTVTDYGLWRNRNSSNVLLTTSALDSLEAGVGNDTASATTHRNGSVVVQVLFYDDWPEFDQTAYRFYEDSDSEAVTEPWGHPDIAENANLSVLPATNLAPGQGQELRLRLGVSLTGNSLPDLSKRFRLQYKQGTDMSCTTGSWYLVGPNGSQSAWTFASSGVSDESELSGTVLSASDVPMVYTKSAPTALNPNSAVSGEQLEYDFHIYNASATEATSYSFRLVQENGIPLSTYDQCPTLTTIPTNSALMRHGRFFADNILQGYVW